MAKGSSASAIQGLLIILIMLGSVVFFRSLSYGTVQLDQIANLNQAELLKVKSSYDLFRQSLSMTFFVSSLQSLYSVGASGAGAGYWYKADPTRPRSSVLLGEDARLSRSSNPAASIPTPNDVSAALSEAFSPYYSISSETEKSGLLFKAGELTPLFPFSFKNSNLQPTFSQRLEVSTVSGEKSVVRDEVIPLKIITDFPKAFLVGEKIVKNLLDFSDAHFPEYVSVGGELRNVNPKFAPLLLYLDSFAPRAFCTQTPSRDDYLEVQEQLLSVALDGSLDLAAPDVQDARGLANLNVYYKKNAFELVPVTEENYALFGVDRADAGSGLYLHYDIDVNVREFPDGPEAAPAVDYCMPSKYDDIIADEVDGQQWSFSSASYTRGEIAAAVKSIINAGSGWDPSRQGFGIGLMKISGTDLSTCSLTRDEAKEPEKNIQCGVRVLHDIMQLSSAQEKENHLPLSLAEFFSVSRMGEAGRETSNPLYWSIISSQYGMREKNFAAMSLRCYDDYLPQASETSQSESSPAELPLSPFAWPAQQKDISACYGFNPTASGFSFSDGIEISGDQEVLAAASGRVAERKTDCTGSNNDLSSDTSPDGDISLCARGNYIVVESEGGMRVKYAGLRDIVSLSSVSAGDKLGESGRLYVEVSKESIIIDPCDVIDCSQSTGLKCSDDFSLFSGLYFRETGQAFVPHPLTLSFKAEDYVPAIDCLGNPYGSYGELLPYRMFNYEKSNDMICCGAKLYTCGFTLSGLDSQSVPPEGSLLDIANSACTTALTTGQSGISVQCTESGFVSSVPDADLMPDLCSS